MQVAATIAVVASVIVLVLQTRAVAKEASIANQVAGTRAHRELIGMLGQIYDRFFEHPELRAHFYGEATTAPSETDRVRLEIISEQVADTLQVALDTTEKLASYGWVAAEWRKYTVQSLAASAVLRSTIRDRPGIWTPLEPLVAAYDAQSHPAQDV
jgi:hypothetical protein